MMGMCLDKPPCLIQCVDKIAITGAFLFGLNTNQWYAKLLSDAMCNAAALWQACALVKKFGNEEKPEFVNYIAFSATVDPPAKYRD
jgi:hypothetical protein